jgi:hypothetical protein
MYSVCTTIKDFLQLHSPTRKCLMQDHIPPGACAMYDMDDEATVIYLSKKERGGVEACKFETLDYPIRKADGSVQDQFLLPTYQFCVKLNGRASRYAYHQECVDAAQAILRYETAVFAELLSRLPADRKTQGHRNLSLASINEGSKLIECSPGNGFVSKIVTNRNTYEALRRKCRNFRDCTREHKLFSAEVVFAEHPQFNNRVYCVGGKEYTGVMAVRDDLYCVGSLFRMPASAIVYDAGFALMGMDMVSCVEFDAEDGHDTEMPSITALLPTIQALAA